ncbi:MAG: threonine--tRNA ligase [Deltaproteobacteria bacterium CG_4_10_14_0_2_um_filter_43_8]|nr:MAG: threonine--tRNA ligase [Deltaproteobacteria bacterium CG11_big_fil_rev_8_21_14_0_20_42_23]PJA22358.1 MAG: threonine--tRNA ligase [Deltaproteobacteria bacterium CG_4_10_14_0_2_um_filter_43_8]PJC64680.1 MAG: threonine--tRNA ligase [Deltaproteobacteria bacterium CG_4_9_14_0_2_um_filter_42_21]
MEEKQDKQLSDLEKLRHSAAHVLADAVQRLYPEAKVTIGPAIEDGFYYDFEYEKGFTTEDLKKIEKQMKRIVAENLPFEEKKISKEEAVRFFKEKNETFKLELIEDIGEQELGICKHGNWTDLCRGGHVESTGKIKAFKLLKVAGSYWRGDEKRERLQRIYGTAFPSQQELDEYLERTAEAEKRDHRKLGKQLGLFSSMEDFGAGLILWHPKGGRIRNVIENYWRSEHIKNGYELVYTPHIARLDLWKVSGHWDFYRDNMFAPMQIDNTEYELKPMNCPFHIQIYKTEMKSYRDLPLRWAELGTVYRYERSGVLHGLMRVRGFTQDDAHIFCRPDQLEAEISHALQLCLNILRTFGFEDFDIYLSTKPEKYVGEDAEWDLATKALESSLKNAGIAYQVDPGEGVFYGPKIDIKIKDSLKRSWQCSTIQVDFNLPERYDLDYVEQGGEKKRPIMVHRALMGSLERFFGVLIEHYAGAFPTWIAPVQAKIIPISEHQRVFADAVYAELAAEGFRVEVDERNEKLGFKIRQAQMEKVPYMLVLGDKEVESKTLAVRSRDQGDLGAKSVQEFVALLKAETTK